MNAPTYINSTHRALARNPGGLTLDEIAGKIRAKAKKAAEQVRELHDLGMIQTTEEAGQPVYKLDEAAAAVPSQTAWMMAGDSEGGEADAPDIAPAIMAAITEDARNEQAADADGWIPWVAKADSVCPVPELTDLEIKLKNKKTLSAKAVAFSWDNCPDASHRIVAYKIIAQAPADFATTPELQYLAPEDYEMPPADPEFLAQANRALGEQLETITAERDDLRARLDAVTQQSIADTDALTQQIEHLRAEVAERDSHLHKITGDTGRSDLAQRLIDHNDERLYHEADVLMYEASDAITKLEHERDQLRAELATERQAREALQEQADYFAKCSPSGYLVCATKRKPRRINDGERAKFAALAAVRAGAARAEVLAVVPVGTARRGAEWRAK